MKWTERLPVSRPFAGIVAIYLGVGLAGAFVMFGYYGGPDGADEWTTTGTLLYDYLTLGLLIAAVYGGFKLSEQIRQTERHHTEQLQASFRPLVLIERAFPFSDPGGMFFGIRMQNPGPGVALDVRVKAWARFIDPALPSAARELAIERLKMDIDLATPTFTLRAGSMAPSGHGDFPLRGVGGDRFPDKVDPNFLRSGGVLLYTISYQDLFGQQFPRKRDLTGSDLGSLLPLPFEFNPLGVTQPRSR